MNIVLINGSPKGKRGISQFLADKFCAYIPAEHTVKNCVIDYTGLKENDLAILNWADTLVFVFPLYIDAIPSHLFDVLTKLEGALQGQNKTVYAIVNCGFYEGRQTAVAMDILKHWCTHTSLLWGQGVGIGAGEMIQFNKKIPLGHGPLKNLGNAYTDLARNVHMGATGDNILISPNFPRFGYMLGSKLYKWYPLFIKNRTSLCAVRSIK